MKRRGTRYFLVAVGFAAAVAVTSLAQQPKIKMTGESQVSKLLAEAAVAYEAKQYLKSAEAYDAAIKAGARGATLPYNAACSYALAGRTDDVFRCLESAVAAGWRDVGHLKNDTDLKSLHGDARWAEIVKRVQNASDAFAKSLKEPALRDELLTRMREDQRIRMAKDPDPEEWRKIDADNTAYMKKVIEKHGWPGFAAVGQDGAQAAFLMVQHADADTAFQKRCLDLLKAAVERKDASAGHLAYLTDRVLVAEGKPQRYGTQFFSEPGGEPKPRPIEDEANVDKRRAEVGLPPLAEYAKQMRGAGR